ncbi:MAG TPA: AMP-binding protein, partial [Marinagarivorans sp.]
MTNKLAPHALTNISIAKGDDKVYTSLMPHQVIEKRAQETPNATAAAYGTDEISYEKLNCRANQLADTMLGKGIETGHRCAVCIKPSLEILIAILAIHKIGAAYVPLDPDAPNQRLGFILDDAKPAIVIYQNNTDDIAPLKKFSTLNLDALAFGQYQEDYTNPNIAVNDSNVATIFYTSGTTGYPKGVLATYKNYRHYINVANDRFSMAPSTVMPAIAKFTFSISLFELIAPLAAGGTVRLIDRDAVLTPSLVIDELKRCTMAHIGPSLWLRILSTMEAKGIPASEFEHFQHVSSGGDLVPPELLKQLLAAFPKAEVYVIYGCSEVSCMATTFFVDRRLPITKTYVGRPFFNTSIAVINYHTQQPTALGDKGEICICSNGVASAYIGSSRAFEKKIITLNGQKFYKTGDIGRLTESLELEMFGREDFQVKVNGVRIELSEIDYHLRKSPNIDQAISMFWRSNDGENKIYAYVTTQLTPQQIGQAREYLQNNLMEQMQPKSFIYIESLPLNINLKVDRKALPEPSPSNIIREAEFGAATNETQAQLLNIWQTLLGRAEIGIDDDFFYSGGSSLQGVDLMEKIERNFKTSLSLNTLLSNRTIRELSQVIDGNS